MILIPLSFCKGIKLTCKKSQQGYVLVVTLFIAMVLFLLGTVLLTLANGELKLTSYFRDTTNAYYIAEGGLQKALSMLYENPNYNSWGSFLNKYHKLGSGKYKVTIQQLDSDTLKIICIGKSGKSQKELFTNAKIIYLNDDSQDEDSPKEDTAQFKIEVISWGQTQGTY